MKHNANNVKICRKYAHTGFDCQAFRIRYEREGNAPEFFESALMGAIDHWEAKDYDEPLNACDDEDTIDLAMRAAELDFGAEEW